MKILIPMAGQGKRFLAAGYRLPKTILEVDGMPVIEHVVRHFDEKDDFVFGVNEDHLKNSDLGKILGRIAPHGNVIPMPYQKTGVLGTLKKMFPLVRGEGPVVVNYGDFSWVWDYADFQKKVRENGCDGAVVCYRGFHPHLLGPNKYATLDAEGLWMKEIREKHSWHATKQEDWTSSGTYYFKSLTALKQYCEKIDAKPEWKIRDEFYVSQLFQLMKEDGLKIFIYEIPFMLQWGTPEDLEEYLYWSDYFREKARPKPPAPLHDMTALILMAGAGKRFQDAGYTDPKPLIPIDEKPMVMGSAASLPRGRPTVFVTRRELLTAQGETQLMQNFPDAKILCVEKLTEGQASTALLAKDAVAPEAPLLIGACDHHIFYDENRFLEMTAAGSGIDALIFTFRRHPAVRRNPAIYGWVETGPDERVIRVSCKTPLPGNPMEHHAIIGAFWFRKAALFFRSAEAMVLANDRINGEFYIDHCMNHVIQNKGDVRAFEVDRYVSWGTPQDLKTYEYWQRFFTQAPFHPYGKRSHDEPR